MAMIPLTGKNPSIDSIMGLDISNPQDGQAIVYDAASGTWKNANAGGGGGGGVLVVTATVDDNTVTCNKTAGEMYAAAQTGLVLVQSDNGSGGFYTNPVTEFFGGEAGYEFITTQDDFEADTANDYPSYNLNN